MTLISLLTASDLQQQLAETIKLLRKRKKLSRKALTEISTVPEATIKKFETTGQISLRQFLLLWQSLTELRLIADLAKQVTQDSSRDSPKSIDDVLKGEM
ncbi:transcriptional regulator [Endozoicomonas sp.]|uniref:transcriptional regulator n=1 Tax=Endozoicomonas sp. TaxID=1892382 RepID=UPI0028886AE9|nr:transcriptional regulator [Endozoicomonas sp.]